MRVPWACLLLGLALAPPAGGQEASAKPRFAVLVGKPDTLQASLEEVARRNYRLVAASVLPGLKSVIILQDSGAARYSYVLVEADVGPQWDGAVNGAAARGYRLLPESVRALRTQPLFGIGRERATTILEHGPAAAQCKYLFDNSLAAGGGFLASVLGDDRGLLARAARAKEQGYEVVGIEIPTSTVTLILEHCEGEARPKLAAGTREHYRILDALRTSAIERDLQRAAAEGYRLVHAPFGSQTAGGISMLVERVAPASFQYVMVPLKDAEKTQALMNEAGSRGYRLLPRTLAAKSFAMEKPSGSTARYQYRIVMVGGDTRDAQRELTEAAEQGYTVVGALRMHVLLERPAD